jgi:hypothetical protein
MEIVSQIVSLFGGFVGIVGGCLGAWAKISAYRSENKMWRIYFYILPFLKEGKTWDPKKANEIKLGEKLVRQEILTRSPMGGYRLHETSTDDDFACGVNIR